MVVRVGSIPALAAKKRENPISGTVEREMPEPVKCTLLSTVLIDVPHGTSIFTPQGGRDEGTDSQGQVSIYMVFADFRDRRIFLTKYYLSWVATDDRCCLMDFYREWDDLLGGYGLHLTTAVGWFNQADQILSTPAAG